MRARYINEKFAQDSDPIYDIGIGTPALINKWMEEHNIDKDDYIINADLTVDMKIFNFHARPLKELPDFIQLNHLSDNLSCYDSGLISVKGFPKSVDGHIYLGHNKLTSIDPLPQYGDIINLMVFSNKLTSLKGCPKSIRGDFNCSKNPLLKTLDGMPIDIGGSFICFNTGMTDEFIEDYLRNNKIHIGEKKIIGIDAAKKADYL